MQAKVVGWQLFLHAKIDCIARLSWQKPCCVSRRGKRLAIPCFGQHKSQHNYTLASFELALFAYQAIWELLSNFAKD